MRLRSVLIVVLLFLFLHSNALSQAKEKKSAPDVVCTIWLNANAVRRGTSVLAHLSIDNNMPEDVVVVSMVGRLTKRASGVLLDKNEETYWSRIDVGSRLSLKPTSDSKHGWTYPETNFVVKQRASADITLDLSLLEWGNEISSTLPSMRLYGVVPDGLYRLNIAMEVRNSANTLGVKSNTIDFEIAPKTAESK